MKPLPVYETFYSWQGEGCHMGKSAFFIRLFGCPIKCPWCDSAGTWHPDFVPETIERISVEALVAQAKEHNPAIVVITGGEPCIHDLT
ncbi:MAG: 7-carboxy-7-deazaguanine synthase QueE, partial [Opitutales bacterium]|nr:7-carboxy-7-deazaguanine synthase QueE [Opitutales bacterium]